MRVLACLLLAVAAWATEPERFPVLTAPPMASTPTIDGQVERREWFGASSTNHLVDLADGTLIAEPGRLYVGYTDTALLIAFDWRRPPHNRHPTPEDIVEIRLKPGEGEPLIWRLNVEQQLAGSDATYAATITLGGWSGELAIPFADLPTPTPGNTWRFNIGRLQATPARRNGWLAYHGRFPPGYHKMAYLRFIEPPVSVHATIGWNPDLQTAGSSAIIANFSDRQQTIEAMTLTGITTTSPPLSYLALIDDELTDDLGDVRGSRPEAVAKARNSYGQVSQAPHTITVPARQSAYLDGATEAAAGHWLSGLTVTADDRILAGATASFDVPEPLGLRIQGYLLAQAISYELDLRQLRDELSPETQIIVDLRGGEGTLLTHRHLIPHTPKLKSAFRTELEPSGSYRVVARLVDSEETIASREAAVTLPDADSIPLWWTRRRGDSPTIPPPFTPLKAGDASADMWGRTYAFTDGGLPALVVTQGEELLAAPIELESDRPWTRSLRLESASEEAAVYRSTWQRDDVTLELRNQVEFDGFMLIDLELTGEGELPPLDLVIPFKTEHAVLMTTYRQAPGPGESTGRFWGTIPEEGYTGPPFITQWIGTDRYGFEFTCESTEGWAMEEPNQAVTVTRQGERTELRIRLISRQLPFDGEPRRIRFALQATPAKPISPVLAKARFHDDVVPALLPGDWSGKEHPVWHPPVTDPAEQARVQAWVDEFHEAGKRLLVNGGWAASVQDPENAQWVPEMFSHPIRDVSHGQCRQYASCWNSPYQEFMVNSFAYNAERFGFDGIRFDTVVPAKCESLAHGCGWFDDDGNLWPRYTLFAARNAWKRFYRLFHGGVVQDGFLWTPVAGPSISCIHSFSDVREIGEGYYQRSGALTHGYPPALVRAAMTGRPHGHVSQNNLKMGPLFYNQRVGAILVNGGEPRLRFMNRIGYEAHSLPKQRLWELGDWLRLRTSDFHGWWENQDVLHLSTDRQVYGSFYHDPDSQRVLLVVCNYEPEPLRLEVQLDTAALGLEGTIYAEDGVTLEPLSLPLTLNLLPEGYRLVKLSADVPQFAGWQDWPVVLETDEKPLTLNWLSDSLSLPANRQVIVSAEVAIEDVLGEDRRQPNRMGRFSPGIQHFAGVRFRGDGVAPMDGMTWKEAMPQWWQPTAGFVRLFLPCMTGNSPPTVRLEAYSTDHELVRVRRLQVHVQPE